MNAWLRVGTPVDDTYLYFSTYGADVSVDTSWVYAVAEVIQPRERWVRIHARFESREGWLAGGMLVAMVLSWAWRVAMTIGG